jgi:hypothetical protein
LFCCVQPCLHCTTRSRTTGRDVVLVIEGTPTHLAATIMDLNLTGVIHLHPLQQAYMLPSRQNST